MHFTSESDLQVPIGTLMDLGKRFYITYLNPNWALLKLRTIELLFTHNIPFTLPRTILTVSHHGTTRREAGRF